MKTPYGIVEEFETTADIGLQIHTDLLDNLFAACAWGMFQLMTNIESVEQTLSFDIELSDADPEGLLVAWLNELIYIHEARGVFLSGFDIHIENTTLKAQVKGERITDGKHERRTGIKAATYHDIQVKKESGHWISRVLFDI